MQVSKGNFNNKTLLQTYKFIYHLISQALLIFIEFVVVFHENLTKFGKPNTGSKLLFNHFFVIGSDGYPQP